MKSVPIGNVAKFTNGRAFKPTEWGDKGLPIIRIQNLTGSSQVVNYYDGEFNRKHLVREGDILISWSASLGVYRWQGEDSLLNQHIFRVVVDDELVDSNYFFYATLGVLDEMAAQVHGTTMRHITKGPFEATEIPLPAMQEQRRIAAILAKADRIRRLRRTAAELAGSYLESVFLRMFGELLDENSMTTFGDVIAQPLQNGLFENNDNYGSGTPVIWVDNLYHTISVDVRGLRRARLSRETLDKYRVDSGDLLFTRSSLVKEGVGQINIVPELNEPTAFECHIIRARVDTGIVDPYYILQLYRSPFGRARIMASSKTATMTTIRQEDVRLLPCPVPPRPMQSRFAAIVRRIEHLRMQQCEAERQAEQLFQSLLHRAFRGEL
jgi:type I restriction enzyme S subunit